jgi:type I restriction enzyme S subunit
VGCSGNVSDGLNFEDLEGFIFDFPSLPEQTKIATFLSAIDQKINHCQAQTEKATIWKKKLLQQLFV